MLNETAILRMVNDGRWCEYSPTSLEDAFEVLGSIRPVSLFTDADGIWPLGFRIQDLVGKVTHEDMEILLGCRLRVQGTDERLRFELES